MHRVSLAQVEGLRWQYEARAVPQQGGKLLPGCDLQMQYVAHGRARRALRLQALAAIALELRASCR